MQTAQRMVDEAAKADVERVTRDILKVHYSTAVEDIEIRTEKEVSAEMQNLYGNASLRRQHFMFDREVLAFVT